MSTPLNSAIPPHVLLDPMWDEEVSLERDMMTGGAEKFRDRVVEATAREEMTRIGAVRHLADNWVPGVAKMLREWVKGVEKSRGPRPIVYPLVKEIDPYVAAMVGTRTILNYIGQAKASLVNVAREIGRTLEHEQKVRLWEKANPKLFWTISRGLDDQKATSEHRARANVNRFNTFVEDGTIDVEWTDWGTERTFRVGWVVLDCVIKSTGWFEITDDPDYVPTHNRAPRLAVTFKEGLINWVRKALDNSEVSMPEFRPMVVKPKPWTGTRDGGYWTPYVKTPRLIRFKASQEHQRSRAADEYDAMDMPKVYAAINMLQNVPWAVNRRVLEVANAVWHSQDRIRVDGIPEKVEKPLPPRTPRMAEHREASRNARALRMDPPIPDEKTQEEIAAWKKQASSIYAHNARRASRLRSTDTILEVADKYARFEEFYFPHMLDFRGRMYPIPTFLHPQGNDLARGLLTFADAAPITKDNGGVRWLAIHLASNWGHDKKPYDWREQWVYDNEQMLRDIAKEPLVYTQWTTADKPFQALAAIFEWVEYLEYGDGYMSCLPVMVDGTCNGIQHLSALTRDETAGAYVNLLPAEQPQDIYKFVAEHLQETLEAIAVSSHEDARLAQWWLDLCKGELPRTLTKRQVMVLPYGGTKDSFFGYTREWLVEYHPAVYEGLSKEDRKELVVFMSIHMWRSVNLTVEGGMKVMKWLQDSAKVACEEDQPIYWKVPSGFIVRHFYGLERDRKIDLLLDGTRCQVRLGERTAKLSKREQLQGISPNFIHSLDASALVECLNRCEEMGITSFSSVHDAYGTHAANMDVLADTLRAAFVHTHEHDLLGMFQSACAGVLADVLIVKHEVDPMDAFEKALDRVMKAAPPLERGELDLQEVLDSPYFFA